jgi:hypothetical protein
MKPKKKFAVVAIEREGTCIPATRKIVASTGRTASNKLP